MDAIVDDFDAGNNKVLVVAPTGLGKSAIMGGMSKYHTDNNPNEVVIVASHLGLLIEQSGDSFMEFWSLPTDVLRAQYLPSPDSRCILTTVQSSSIFEKIFMFVDNLPEGVKVGMIQLDEAHINSGTDTVEKLLGYFPESKVIGYTGSPFKSNKDMSHLYDRTSYSVSLQQAIDAGYLVKPVMNSMFIEDKEDLEEVMSACFNIIKRKHTRDKGILFFRKMDDAKNAAEALRSAGFTAEAIVSSRPDTERAEILDKYRKNTHDSVQFLTTVDVLSVGFDAPALKFILMPYGTGSVSTYLQRVGRGLRKFKGKAHCDIYIGGTDPKIEKGKWEKIQRKALNAGKRHDNVLDDLEVNDHIMEPNELKLTKELAAMYRGLKKGMPNLADMVVNREFPCELLEHLVNANRVPQHNSRAKITSGQSKVLTERGVKAENLSRNEASVIIDAIAKREKWSKATTYTVPRGKHMGKDSTEVPWSYISLVSKKTGKYYDPVLHEFFKKARGVR